jgi:uncharacterized membrane protein YoaK (UPF0700 family)
VHCFSGHVTGNSVLAAIALTSGGATRELLLAILCFLGATAFAQRLRSSTDRPLGCSGFRYVLIAEIILLLLSPYTLGGQHRALFIVAMCLAFGLQNGVLSKADGIGLHSTYLTGTLTHLLAYLYGRVPQVQRQPNSKRERSCLFGLRLSQVRYAAG